MFHLEYALSLPFPYIFVASASQDESEMRFDSACCIGPGGGGSEDMLGSVFDRTVPGFGYAIHNEAVRGVAAHLLKAQANPAGTFPDAGRQNPCRDDAERNSQEFQSRMPNDGNSYNCDEYPMTSTLKGVGRCAPEYDGAAYGGFDSVQLWIARRIWKPAAGSVGRSYVEDRILYREAFSMPITS